MISPIFTLFFSLDTPIIKKLLYDTKKRKKKHNEILYLCKNKLDCVEMLISQSIMDLNISHEEFKMIVDEKKDYDNQKQHITDKKLTENA